MRRRPEPLNAWTVALCAVFLIGIVATLAWALRLEQPYPCSGRGNCGAEVVR